MSPPADSFGPPTTTKPGLVAPYPAYSGTLAGSPDRYNGPPRPSSPLAGSPDRYNGPPRPSSPVDAGFPGNYYGSASDNS
ncbi:uncharacterized protein LOC134503512 [Candoia aspera]|uniref:uncharacterized protein LOC134503512 n=1 Tax=Candoia aspera TaxID=51853 RepID=UPI002FD854D1